MIMFQSTDFFYKRSAVFVTLSHAPGALIHFC